MNGEHWRLMPRPPGVWTCVLEGLSVVLALGTLACSSGQSSSADQPSLPQTQWLSGADPEQVLRSSYCETPRPGETPLRRLSNREYENTLIELGFDPALVEQAVASLPNEPESLGFRNAASALSVTSLLAEKYQTIAERLTTAYGYPCELADDSACANEMIQRAGNRVFRRPLTLGEEDTYRSIYDQARARNTQEDSLAWVLRAMLQSPHFLYRVEIPEDVIAPVRGDEMANRLSYMLWQSPPDAELRRAARTGELNSRERVLEQAQRMLQDPKAESLLEFFEQWLDLDDLHEVRREGPAYADTSPQLGPLLRKEAQAFLLDLLRTPNASYQDLLASEYTFANAELAEHYGLPPVEGDAFRRVEAPARRGILSQGMLVAQDGPTRTSIVRRGLKIRTDLLCQTVPAPPDTVDLTLAGIGEDLTQAERLELHSESVTCSGCHRLMDPIGGAFESFDAVGRRRTQDEFGNPIDDHGQLTNTLDADGALDGIDGVARRLSQSEQAQQCYMIQNLRFYLGREVEAVDLCSQAQVYTRFREDDFSLVGLLLAIIGSDAFLFKAAVQDLPDQGSDQKEGAQP